MIKITDLSFSFPDKDLYNNILFTIDEGASAAFIGSSGSGKSTLIEMIIDREKYLFDGKIEIDDECNIAYVSQFYDCDRSDSTTVFEYIAQPFTKIQSKIDSICEELGTASEIEQLLEDYQTALDEFDAIDGDNYESNISKKLGLANLADKKDLEISKLSGGEFKLIQVIKQMLSKPHFIIMDEPDAFLDFDNLNSLKNLINSHKGTLLAITHSRYLLNHCFNKILHLTNKKVREFDGSYIDYNFELLEKNIELQELAFADEEEIKRNEALIDKLQFIAEHYDSPANGRSLNARIKIQERLEARKIEMPVISTEKPAINFVSENVAEDDTILELRDFSLAFEDTLLENINFEIKSTDKVAIIGANGTGKTSLIREIFKNNSDNIIFSPDANVSYLSQNKADTFDEDKNIYDAFFDIGFNTYGEVSEYLLTFGFPEEKMNQKIGSLSGGEKNILGLAKLSKERVNMLILDEPTSHLDTYCQIALEEAINGYDGAILMVCHDFYSIVNCMDYVLIIEDKTIRKMQMKKFKRMIYAKHFDRNYLELEQSKKEIELKIDTALSENNFEKSKLLMPELEKIIKQM